MLGHEISHVRNRDTYLMTMATIFAGVIALIADIGFRMLLYGGGRSRRGGGALIAVLAVVGLLLAPYAALLLRMSLSRRREFLADAGSADSSTTPRRWRSRSAGLAGHDDGRVRGRVRRTPVGGEHDEPGRVRASRRSGAHEPVRHASSTRRAHRGSRGIGRVPTFPSSCHMSVPFAVELGLGMTYRGTPRSEFRETGR